MNGEINNDSMEENGFPSENCSPCENVFSGGTTITCITGKMASGKNFISALLEKRGFVSVDADVLVHQAINNSAEKILNAFSDIAAAKGIDLQNADGSINRRAVGKLIFPHPELLKKQEEIVYPEVIRLAKTFISENSGKNILINATVAYKTPEILSFCSRILYVRSPFTVRLNRAKKRDKMKTRQILQRFKSQRNLLSEYKKTGIPVTVIRNTGSEKSIMKRLEKVFDF